MIKVRVRITQELELPDKCSVVEGIGSKLIKYINIYLSPNIEFVQSNEFSDKELKFTQLEEDTTDMICRAMILEKKEMEEI